MRPGAALAVRLLPKYLALEERPTSARELLRRIARSEAWLVDEEELAERAEAWEEPFLRRVRNELSALYEIGRFAPFSINSSAPDFLQGSAFVEPHDPPDVVKAKRARSQMAEYSSALSALTSREFEVLCTGLLSLLGVENVTTTPYSADEGIDFYGIMRADGFLAPNQVFTTFSRQMSIWLLGQAKHYTANKVATPDLRELVGSVELAKAQAFGSVALKYEYLKIRLCDPVFFLFFTTGNLTAAAWRLATRSGVIALDGEMIAAFFSDHEIGIADGHYSDATFAAWLEAQRAA